MSLAISPPKPRERLHPLATLLAGHGGVAAISLLRNILAARWIGIEQFGIAASFAIVLSIVEMATNLGLQQMIVRDQRGDTPRFQATLHLVQLAKGLLGAVVIYAAAEPLAQFMMIPEASWAIRALALVPLMSSLTHLDCWRYQRYDRFWPSIVVQLGPAILSLLLLVPLVNKFGDFRVLLVASLAQAAGMLIMSHLLSEQRYAIRYHRLQLRSVVRFGSPLALNGMLLLAVFHGEKLIVAHLMGPTALALIAMGFTLTLTPALIIGKSLQSYALPGLSRSVGTPAFSVQARHVITHSLWCGVGLSAVLACLSFAIPALLGSAFITLVPLMPILAVLHGLRVAKTGISIVALAMGDTVNTVLGNIPRLVALPLTYSTLSSGGSLWHILWIAVLAEAAGLIAASFGLWSRLHRG
jgi:O-antigen/teichoic acid export membrane protein